MTAKDLTAKLQGMTPAIALGAKKWVGSGTTRYYFNNLNDLYGLLCTIGISMTTPATGDQTEREMIALGLVRHITSGHAIGLTLTAAGRVEFERRWRYRAG